MPRVATTNIINNPKRYGYDVRVDTLLLRSAVGPGREMTIQSSDVQEAQINVKQNAEDFTSNLGRIYSRNNFTGGQGLDTAHRADGTPKDTTRFWDSKGIDVFHADDETSYNIHLLHTTAEKNVTFNGDNNYITRTQNGYLYVTDENDIYLSTDHGENFSVVTTGLTVNYNYTGITSVGNRVFAVTADGTSHSEVIEFDGTTWHERNTHQHNNAGITFIGFAKGQLFIAADDGTVEYVWAVSPFDKNWTSSDLDEADAIFTHEDTTHISQITDAGAVVLLSSTDGNIYSVKDVAGTMTLKGQTTIPFEEVHSIAASEGIVFFGTKETARDVGRFYRADLTVADDLYVLANRQLVKEWVISGVDTTPKHMFVSRDSIYCGIKENGSESYLWRYYLPTAGFARDIKMNSTSGFITGITQADGKFIVCVTGVDIYKETSTYESTGYLITSAADFFTAESKQFVGAEISTFSMEDNTNVELRFSNVFEDLDNPDSTNFSLAIKQTEGVGDSEKQISPVARYIMGKLVLNSTDGVNTPKVKSLQFRALARPELVVAQVPINISDRVERPGRKPIKVKGLGDTLYNELRQLEGDAVTLELFDPDEIIRGVVERISYPIQTNTEIGSVTHYAVLTVRGTRQPVVTPVSSLFTFGVETLGKMRFGG